MSDEEADQHLAMIKVGMEAGDGHATILFLNWQA